MHWDAPNIYHRCMSLIFRDRRGGVEIERSPRVREIGVRSLVATDPSRKNGSDTSTAKRSATGVSVTGPRR